MELPDTDSDSKGIYPFRINTSRSEEEVARDYFTNHPNFHYERKLGSGAFGTAFIFREYVQGPGGGTFFKNWAVKFSQHERDVDDLKKEINFLQKLRGALHIAQPRAASQELDNTPTTGLLNHRVALITELASHGTLDDFLMRVRRTENLPNRVCWIIFLCLIRMMCACCYPPNRRDDDPVLMESLTELRANPQRWQAFTIAHMDLVNLANFVFDDLRPHEEEHSLLPILKLIDFGCAETEADSNGYWGNIEQTNVYSIGMTMMSVLGIWRRINFDTSRPDVDRALGELVLRCIGDVTQRPDLDELTAIVEDALDLDKDPSAIDPGKWQGNNSDVYIKGLVERCMLSADSIS
ncbi:hypothetical protein F5Y16DRAFT_405227 [Xylariaceae sp. FL0255]|nr:hypothetical protein F5Y16DRAFT_405227 [Xylariaceae sp. FL0255]